MKAEDEGLVKTIPVRSGKFHPSAFILQGRLL
jgi:hypothetical protein